jgi:DNA (cytosine-5)-methyltransferase 1
VFVVASARADFDPAAVLFEFDGVRRDTAPSREAREKIAPCVTNGPPFSRTGNERVEAEAMVVQKKWPAELASTLDTTFGTKQGLEDQHVNNGCPLFVPAQPVAIQGNMIGRNDNAGPQGVGVSEEVMYTLTKVDVHGVAQPISFQPGNLKRGCGSEPNSNVFPTLAASHGRGASDQDPHVMQTNMAVRRLTPVECERLQGFPDGYTNIPWRKKDESPDGPRYKALGNSWAVPVVRWIGERIAKVT